MGKMKLLVLERPWFSDNFQVCGVGVRPKKKKSFQRGLSVNSSISGTFHLYALFK